jgi:hypothetical protein
VGLTRNFGARQQATKGRRKTKPAREGKRIKAREKNKGQGNERGSGFGEGVEMLRTE